MIQTSVNNEARLLRDVVRNLRTPRLRSRLAWAEQELVIPDGEHEGTRFRSDTLPYTKLLLGEIDKRHWRRVVVTGPSQGGKTLSAFVIPTLYHLFEIKEKVICGVPDMDMAGDKWRDDLLPAIEASRYRYLLPLRGKGTKGGTPDVITFRNGSSLKFVSGGGGDKERAGKTARVLVVTETDGMDVRGGGSAESDKLAQMEARTFSYADRAQIYLECTVSTEEGFTWKKYQEGTASRIISPCRHCGKWVSPEREHFLGWQDAETGVAAGRSAGFFCPECGGGWSDLDRREMNLQSKLVHRGQEVTDTGEIVGTPVETDTFGFRWSAFHNLFQPSAFLGEQEWEAAQSEDNESAELKLKQFIWCIPPKDENVEKVELTVGVVRGSARGYAGRCSGLSRGDIPDGTEFLTCFVDIGKRVLTWSVSAWTGKYDRSVIDYGFFETSLPDVVGEEVAISEALDSLRAELESRYRLDAPLVDSGHWNTVIFEFVKRSPGWRATKGIGESTYRHPRQATDGKWPSPNGDRWYLSHLASDGVWEVNFDADWFKHRVHAGYQVRPLSETGERRSGAVTLFGTDPQEHSTFADQITAEEFLREFTKARGWKESWKKKRRDNHLLDCDVGNLVAHSLCLARRSQEADSQTVVTGEVQEPRGFTSPDGRPFLITER